MLFSCNTSGELVGHHMLLVCRRPADEPEAAEGSETSAAQHLLNSVATTSSHPEWFR